MGVSLQKVTGLSGVLKVALSNKNSGKLGQNLGKQSLSLISIGWSAAAANAAGIHLTEGSSHGAPPLRRFCCHDAMVTILDKHCSVLPIMTL